MTQIKAGKSLIQMKIVNLEAEPMFRLAKGVDIEIGDWSRSTNFIALPLDDFQVILGWSFCKRRKQ